MKCCCIRCIIYYYRKVRGVAMKKAVVIISALVVVLLGALIVYDATLNKTVSESFFAMNTLVSAEVTGISAKEDCEEIENIVSELDVQTLSRTSENSEIFRINKNGGGEISGKTAEYFSLLLDVCEKSGGAFDFTLGAVSDLWNFGGNPSIPDSAALSDALSHSGYKKLSHRDYLGSVLSLGISRDFIGDILVFDGYALIIVKSEMADFIELNYSKAGKTNLTAEILEIQSIEIPENNIREVTDTVSSLRLDAVVSSAFSVSRGVAAAFISAGSVYVNDMLTQKVDLKVSQGDKIKVQKKGRAILKEVGGLSRKGRIAIKIERHI